MNGGHASLCPPYDSYDFRGLIHRAPIITATANTAGMTASHMPAAASAAVAAQLIEANASANVAMRDEVWRRRKWLRFACARNQSWIAVAEPAATTTPLAATHASNGASQASAARNGENTMSTAPSTASTLARRMSRAL